MKPVTTLMLGIKPGQVIYNQQITKLMQIILKVPQIIPYFIDSVHTMLEKFEMEGSSYGGGFFLRFRPASTELMETGLQTGGI